MGAHRLKAGEFLVVASAMGWAMRFAVERRTGAKSQTVPQGTGDWVQSPARSAGTGAAVPGQRPGLEGTGDCSPGPKAGTGGDWGLA